jgi:methyl-accepting chemotaxis protein
MEGLERELIYEFYSEFRRDKAPELERERRHLTRTPHYLVNNANLRSRAQWLFVVVCLACLGALGTAYTTLTGLNGSVGKLNDVSFRRVLFSEQLRTFANQSLLAERDLLAEDLMKGMQDRKVILDAHVADFENALKKVSETMPAGDEDLSRLRQAWDDWKSFDREVLRLALGGDPDSAIVYYRQDAESYRERLESSTLALVDHQLKEHEEAYGISADLYTKYRDRILIAGALLVLIVLLSAFVLNGVSSAVEEFANGMRKHSFHINVTTNRILNTAVERMSSFSEQKVLLAEMSVLIEEANGILRRNAKAAAQASKFFDFNRKRADEDREAAQDLVRLHGEVKSRHEELIRGLEECHGKLNSMTTQIEGLQSKSKFFEDILVQAKLVLFNANVETSRADEQGRESLSKIAEAARKIEKLAEESAAETTSFLREQAQEFRTATQAMHERLVQFQLVSDPNLEQSGKIAKNWIAALGEIGERVTSSHATANEMLKALEDHKFEVDELKRSFEKLDSVAGRCSENSDFFFREAEDLRQQSDALRVAVVSLVESFTGHIGAERVPRLPPKPPRTGEKNLEARKAKAERRTRPPLPSEATSQVLSFRDPGSDRAEAKNSPEAEAEGASHAKRAKSNR